MNVERPHPNPLPRRGGSPPGGQAGQGITDSDWAGIRGDFPLLTRLVHDKPLVYLDSANTGQKPAVVIEAIDDFYRNHNANVSRAVHALGAEATEAYEGSRIKLAKFLNVRGDELVLCSGTTFAINLVAYSWALPRLRPGDAIVLTRMEHHANIVPWQQLCARTGAKLRVIPVDDDGQVRLDEYAKLLNARTKLVSFTQVSNALGTVTPAKQIVAMAHSAGAKVLVDGAQSVSHLRADVIDLDCDWFVFSGHKVFGPTGIGVLYGKEALLNETPPWQGGGNMIKDVNVNDGAITLTFGNNASKAPAVNPEVAVNGAVNVRALHNILRPGATLVTCHLLSFSHLAKPLTEPLSCWSQSPS